MAPVHGRHARIYVNEIDASGFLNSASITATGDTAEITAFGDTWKEHIAGQSSATFSAQGHHDADLLELDANLGTGGQVVTYCPGGASAIGDLARLVSLISTTVSTSAPVGGVVALGWDGMADTSVGAGWVLHPNGEDTNNTTGASRDDAAATATGWQAHLHVTGPVDGGSWVIKLQDSANNSDWDDVTGGAFTAATDVTSQRLVSAAATTALRRYVRYVATRTGGSAGNGITFQLSYARNV
jgi:hypothetical protein